MLCFWPGWYTLIIPTPTHFRLTFAPKGGDKAWKWLPMLAHARALIGLANPPMHSIVLAEATDWYMNKYETVILDGYRWDSEKWGKATILVE
jgi:hypothetical protein